ncbi:hypothetical protein IU433_00135 [Nocardia puris]|nr:hypothetical protein [Nocardia puris]MBF6210195.1 hypothetical protein [Nocardia puris]MBF6367272.1 hypothetical protein [Nocardia puris]MBF6457456.1 hypothetical protein [Nocardia puris]
MSATGAFGASFEPGRAVEEVFEGAATGVEVEPDLGARPEVELEPWDPEKIRVTTRQFALRDVLDMIDDDDLELAPDFSGTVCGGHGRSPG